MQGSELSLEEKCKIEKLIAMSNGRPLICRHHQIEPLKQFFFGSEQITDPELVSACKLLDHRLPLTCPTESTSEWIKNTYSLERLKVELSNEV